MSKITGLWKRRLRPLVLTAIRQRFGLGVPTPGTATTVATLAAAGGCESLHLDTLPRQVFPSHGVTGDLAAVARVRAEIDN